MFTVWGPLTCHVKSRLWCIFQKSDRWSSSFFDVDFHQQRRKKKCSDWEGSCMCGLVAALYQLMHTTGSDTCCIPFQKITTAVGAPCWCPKEPGVTSVCVHTPDCLHCRCKHVSLCCYLSVNRSVYCMCECVYWKPKYGNQSFVFRSVILKWWVVTQNWAVGINLACCGAGGYIYYSFLQYTQQRTQCSALV